MGRKIFRGEIEKPCRCIDIYSAPHLDQYSCSCLTQNAHCLPSFLTLALNQAASYEEPIPMTDLLHHDFRQKACRWQERSAPGALRPAAAGSIWRGRQGHKGWCGWVDGGWRWGCAVPCEQAGSRGARFSIEIDCHLNTQTLSLHQQHSCITPQAVICVTVL